MRRKSGTKNTPGYTKIHQTDGLEPKYRVAIELKLRSVSYQDIADHEEIKVTRDTVKSWFKKDGLLYEAYQERKKERTEEIEERFADADSRIKELVPDALNAYEVSIKKRGSWKAAESLLDRAGFQPVQKVETVTPAKIEITYVRPSSKTNSKGRVRANS